MDEIWDLIESVSEGFLTYSYTSRPDRNSYGSPIPVDEEAKFFDLLVYKKLTFIPHIKALKAKCIEALKMLSTWGGDRSFLLNLYRSFVLSKLGYG